MAATDDRVVSSRGHISRKLLFVFGGFIYFFLFFPIGIIILFSFNANKFGTFPITGWTFSWYGQVYHDFQIHEAVVTSLKLAAQVTILATVIGTAAAFPLVRSRMKFRHAVRVGFTIPIMIPGLLIGISLLVFFTQVLGIQTLGIETAVIGQTVFTAPFVLLLVAARLEGFDRSLERAASDLGANMWNRLRLVLLPLLLPAIFAGALFAFTLSIDEYVITSFLIGTDTTVPIYIFGQVKYGITPEVNALASLLILASVLLLASALGLSLLGRWLRRQPPAAVDVDMSSALAT